MHLLPRFHALLAFVLLAQGCDVGAGTYEEAARETAAAIGADDLTLLDTVSNFAGDTGRTARFTIAGDPIGVVTLHFSNPERCAPNPDCAAQLRDSISYGKGQSAFAARLAQAFAPCGFRAAANLELVTANLAPSDQWARGSVVLDLPQDASGLARAQACAEAVRGGKSQSPEIDLALSKLNAAQAELQRATLEHFFAMKEHLDPDQAELLLKWTHDSIVHE